MILLFPQISFSANNDPYDMFTSFFKAAVEGKYAQAKKYLSKKIKVNENEYLDYITMRGPLMNQKISPIKGIKVQIPGNENDSFRAAVTLIILNEEDAQSIASKFSSSYTIHTGDNNVNIIDITIKPPLGPIVFRGDDKSPFLDSSGKQMITVKEGDGPLVIINAVITVFGLVKEGNKWKILPLKK